MKIQKCCSHCPGKLVALRSNEFHECCQPNYVSGNLKVSSLRKRVPESFSRREMEKNLPLPEQHRSSYDQFALAKRLHAENLQHQPLPDKVHDSVFKNPCPRPCRRLPSGRLCECCEQVSKNDRKNLNKRYGPILGCKEPKTKMDLAICWETPVDPVYEPPRPSHIDGSEGGLAPAIFTLVEHASKSSTNSLRVETVKNQASPGRCKTGSDQTERPRNKHKGEDQKREKCCCECLCRDLNGVNISKKDETQSRRSFRKCTACGSKNVKDDPRLTKSAVGLALGLEKGGNGQKRNDGKMMVPRPRTPFARRSFCIDTLTPPFSVVNGSRDADYPEHWRLMSVYQQSYKNPYKRRSLYHC
ncbi:uncharacterized protein LOC114877368 [Osmia bicornis bicornis]|uniref:uncharacterized protein LOC114877368 n=1 Tax=Osmia bicornis bicornis TaxID=1437191 RepID=UPI001EAEEC25|nr:uncharacterized protein LOC114877368 [Osmia bicornis bicornis]XP_046142210.1 uncharacterized protein LOC114877368 [Osmia bicornis bicornis]XP_046142211.1 uncharacterized protein LOC114877368 [Osmia bicornis bicornis]